MVGETSLLAEFIEHIGTETQPFVLRRDGQPPVWADSDTHRAAYALDPELYALCGLLDSIARGQRQRVLFRLLEATRRGVHPEVRENLDRVIAVLLAVLPPDDVLTVFLALRRVRANHKHVSRAIVTYLLNHPEAESLFRWRRPAVIDCLEHALGKATMRACARLLGAGDTAEARRKLLRFARDAERATALVTGLYAASDASRTEGSASYGYVTRENYVRLDGREERAATVTAETRGAISAALVRYYGGDESPEVGEALAASVERAAARLPRYGGRVALVLDVSASTRGYGDREYCCIAQSMALRLALGRCCERLDLYTVGVGGRFLARPEGQTDLAGALLDALAGAPDLVLIVSDGYENRYAGDLARVAASLPSIGVETPVVFCHSKFTGADDLALRRPATGLPALEFWHEADFTELTAQAFAYDRGPRGAECLREFLRGKLRRAEREMELWTA